MSSKLFLGLVLGVLTYLVGGLFLRSGSAFPTVDSFPDPVPASSHAGEHRLHAPYCAEVIGFHHGTELI